MKRLFCSLLAIGLLCGCQPKPRPLWIVDIEAALRAEEAAMFYYGGEPAHVECLAVLNGRISRPEVGEFIVFAWPELEPFAQVNASPGLGQYRVTNGEIEVSSLYRYVFVAWIAWEE